MYVLKREPIPRLWSAYQRRIEDGTLKSLAELGLPAAAESPHRDPRSIPRMTRKGGLSLNGEAAAVAKVNRLLERFKSMKESVQEKRMDTAMEYPVSNKEMKLLEACMEFLYAAKSYDLERVKELLDLGVPVNFQHPVTGMTAMHWAGCWGHEALVDLLAETGRCNFLIRDFFNRTAYNMATLHNTNDAVIGNIRERTLRQAEQEGIPLDKFLKESRKAFKEALQRGEVDARAAFENYVLEEDGDEDYFDPSAP